MAMVAMIIMAVVAAVTMMVAVMETPRVLWTTPLTKTVAPKTCTSLQRGVVSILSMPLAMVVSAARKSRQQIVRFVPVREFI